MERKHEKEASKREWEILEELLKGVCRVDYDTDGDGNMVLIIEPNYNHCSCEEHEILVYTYENGDIASIHIR